MEKHDELASNSDEAIFFPLENKSDYGFEKELRIIKRSILETKETKNEIESFLGKLKIQKAKPYEIIEKHILPIYENKNESLNWQIKDDAVLLGYINYIFNNIEDYEKEKNKWLKANKITDHPLKRLKNSLMIRTNKIFDPKKNYDRPENIYLPKYYGNKNDLETLFVHNEDIQFVSKEYIKTIVKNYRDEKRKDKNKKKKAEIRKNRETEIKAWREFFDKIGVFKIPKVIFKYNKIHDPFSDLAQNYGYTGSKLQYKSYLPEESFHNIKAFEEITDYKLELDIQNLNTKLRIMLLKIIDENWSYYYGYFTKQLEYKYRYSRTNYVWIILSRDCYFKYALINTGWLPITKNIDPLPLSKEVFLDKPETKTILGESVPYLAVEVKNQEFIKALKINSDPTVEGVLNHLKNIVQKRCIDKGTFLKLYDFLSKNFENNQTVIRTAFTTDKIIFIPDTHQYYFTIRDVLWKDLSDIFGENRGYLQKHYQKAKSFFVDKLVVNEKATPKDYADILLYLSRKEKIDKRDEHIIIEIYNELNSHLDTDIEEHLISLEDWWDKFIQESIFWTDKNEFWYNNNDIYINDKQEIYELFKNNSQIAFLKIPQNYHPQIQYFINSAKISYLSEAKPKLANVKTSEIENQLTEKIRRFFPYILRYLYYSDYKTYEKLKKLGIFTHLKNFMCYSAESIEVEYILNKQSITNERKTFLDNDWKLYIKKDSLEDVDNLTVALSDFLKSKGIEYFLISLFEKNSDDKIEKLLRAMGIEKLPEGEKEEQETKSTKDQQKAAKDTESEEQPEPESTGNKEKQEIKSTKDQQDVTKDTESEGQSEPESPGKKEKQEIKSTKDQQDVTKDTESERQSEPESPGKNEKQEIKSTKDQQDVTKDTESEGQSEPESPGKKEKQETKSTKNPQNVAKDTENEWQSEPNSKEKKEETASKSTRDQHDAVKDKEDEWKPDFDPDDVEIKFDEFQKKKFEKPKISDAKNKSNKKPVSSDEEDEVMDKLSPKAKKAIGKWGEEYALKCLQEKFCTKYSDGNIEIQADGLIIKYNGQIKVEIHWLNTDFRQVFMSHN